MIPGHMQEDQFNLISILQHAARWHGSQEVVTNTVEGGVKRLSYKSVYDRTAQLAHALIDLGVKPGDRIGTMAWNTHRHLECWYAIAGTGGICHTLNPRLSSDQLDFIVNHAEDRIIFVDLNLYSLVEAALERLPSVERIVVLTDKAHMPDTSASRAPVHCYEDLIKDCAVEFDWPSFDENTASGLCYTSGTTGDPKGVLYSHRSNILHAYATSGADVFSLRAFDSVLMVVPMFHANSWGLAFSAPMVGAKLVLPGPNLDGESIATLVNEEGVTKSAAVPTVWTGLLDHLDATSGSIETLSETYIAGSAVPRSMIERFKTGYDVTVIHAWGMTELSPLGTINRPLPAMTSWSDEERLEHSLKQGRPMYGIDMKIVGDDGAALPHDGVAFGKLMVRGPWVVERYYRAEASALDGEGWFDTGDVATIDAYGYMHITDRAKDVIKSGGEWISSVEIENAAVGHPGVQIAACVGVQHPKWEERPLLIVVSKPGVEKDKDGILSFVAKSVAKWQVPDDVVFIDEMPLTATGKIDKKPLRAAYTDYLSKASKSV